MIVIYYGKDGCVYIGEFKEDVECGKGVYTDHDVRVIGEWENGYVICCHCNSITSIAVISKSNIKLLPFNQTQASQYSEHIRSIFK